MAGPSLGDLVANRTLSPAMAATLAAAAAARRSLLVFAIPRLVGKTTTLLATLEHAPPRTPIHELSLEEGPGLGIPDPPQGGYLLMHEIAQTAFPSYLWGEPVRRTFEALRGGELALATALHAGGIEEAFAIILEGNAVPDADAALLDFAVYIRSLGPDWREPTRRVVAELHEISGVEAGKVEARLLHRWDEASDRFEAVAAARRLSTSSEELEQRTAEFAQRLSG